ncbi:MAG TPA: AlkA N-terminal domain-containing protein [Nocardioidaceae bacterium]|nr:helix-turn-helix domain-containing protein [Actinomycetota bacterium]MDQ3424185.1 helix-turn-helix domain-containing protein [Actinomycetota bacterium]HEV8056229.1 AlkA N-terminal domain-containing protein [Nocardioidaceae bacterium]
MDAAPVIDEERCYRAVRSRDRRFDGVFYTAVTSTRIYCRPSCPAITPRRPNVRFYPSAAAAQAAGFRACKRCLPDATPGSPRWDLHADMAGRAMRLINDGVVERDGVGGLAARLGFSSRHLNRVLVQEVGAGPLALARSRRAQTARILIETTEMPFADAAFAAGFSSIRQFNDTVREVYAATPSQLRASSPRGHAHDPAGRLEIRLAVRQPFDGEALLGFLSVRAVPGVEQVVDRSYRRTLRLPHGIGVVSLTPGQQAVRCTLELTDLRDVTAAVERCRRLLDLDADPEAVDGRLGTDDVLAPLVARRPGLRVPGHVDGAELTVRAVLGQQISVAAACTLVSRLVLRHGDPLPPALSRPGLTHLFPAPATLAALDPAELSMPLARGRALTGLCRAVVFGDVVLDRAAERRDVEASLLAVPGIGPWTAGYVAMRALGDPDVFLPTDVGVRRALRRRGVAGPDGTGGATVAASWRPWRSYALMHLWTALAEENR